MPKQVKGFAAMSATSPLTLFNFERRSPGPTDVQLEILFCGICHSDLHAARNEWSWMTTVYPLVPGHEIVGRVTQVGDKVKSFKIGNLVAVGCMVDSCRACPQCLQHQEQFCDKSCVATFNSPDPHNGKTTYGGYSSDIVVDEKFVLKIPNRFSDTQLPSIAPLLCAGITTYSPLRHWNIGKGMKVGIVGLGGLGHMALKIAHALGAHVVLFTTSPEKIDDAKRLGANEVVVSKNSDDMRKHLRSFDFILNTAAASHNLNHYLDLLKVDGTMCMVGLPSHPHTSMDVSSLIMGRRQLAGSLIGGIQETQEMLDFCAEHNITSDIELIPIQKVNECYERMLKNDVKYRFVIDMASLK